MFFAILFAPVFQLSSCDSVGVHCHLPTSAASPVCCHQAFISESEKAQLWGKSSQNDAPRSPFFESFVVLILFLYNTLQ